MKQRFPYLMVLLAALSASSSFGATDKTGKPTDPTPGDPLVIAMGQRKPARIRVACAQATLIRLPDGQRVMSVYGGDKGEGGLWSIDAGKVPTRFLAVKPKEAGIHTTLHVISNTGQEISLFAQEVTGVDTQFDAEVDAEDGHDATATVTPEIKWVPVDEVLSCRAHADTLQVDAAQALKKAQVKSDATLAEFQAQYPRKLFFGYEWDQAKAEQLGFQMAWSDDKFTYFRGKQVLALYEINEDGKPSLIQYRYDDGLYTVPKLLFDGYFAIGTKKGNKLTFHRDRGKS